MQFNWPFQLKIYVLNFISGIIINRRKLEEAFNFDKLFQGVVLCPEFFHEKFLGTKLSTAIRQYFSYFKHFKNSRENIIDQDLTSQRKSNYL